MEKISRLVIVDEVYKQHATMIQAICVAAQDPQYTDIFDAIRGIIFLGTPHQGCSLASFTALIALVTSYILGSDAMLPQMLRFRSP